MRPDTCQVTEDVRSAERPFFVRRRASAEQFYGAKLAIKKNKKRGGGGNFRKKCGSEWADATADS